MPLGPTPIELAIERLTQDTKDSLLTFWYTETEKDNRIIMQDKLKIQNIGETDLPTIRQELIRSLFDGEETTLEGLREIILDEDVVPEDQSKKRSEERAQGLKLLEDLQLERLNDLAIKTALTRAKIEPIKGLGTKALLDARNELDQCNWRLAAYKEEVQQIKKIKNAQSLLLKQKYTFDQANPNDDSAKASFNEKFDAQRQSLATALKGHQNKINRWVMKSASPNPLQQQNITPQLGDYSSYPLFNTSKVMSVERMDSVLRNASAQKALHQDTNLSTVTTDRDKFIQLIDHLELDPSRVYRGRLESRKSNPKEATISLEKYLGKEGLALYKKALKEEMNSIEYRNAVFRASTTHFEGNKLDGTLVVHVAGPSACGKSFAAQNAVEAACKHESVKKTDVDEGNDFVSIDNGIGREVSQMRKLLIRSANNHGFTGLYDLDKQSNTILKPMKEMIREAALAAKLNMVIPDTYSTFDPLGIGVEWGDKKQRFLDIDNLPGYKQVFCEVVGANPDEFKSAVEYMGNSRAWKTDFIKKSDLWEDMNSTQDLPESKAYHREAFESGRTGSEKARKHFETHSKSGNLTLSITNDFILLKKDENGGWIQTKTTSEAERKISAQVYNAWLEQKSSVNRTELEAFEQECKLPPLIGTPTLVRQSHKTFLATQADQLGFQEKVPSTKGEDSSVSDLTEVRSSVGTADKPLKKESSLILEKTGENTGTKLILTRAATGTVRDTSSGSLTEKDKNEAALQLAILFLSEYNGPTKGKIQPIYLKGNNPDAIQRAHAAILFLAKESKAEVFKDIQVISSQAGPSKGWLYGKQSDAFIRTHLGEDIMDKAKKAKETIVALKSSQAGANHPNVEVSVRDLNLEPLSVRP